MTAIDTFVYQGLPSVKELPPAPAGAPCSIEGCNRPALRQSAGRVNGTPIYPCADCFMRLRNGKMVILVKTWKDAHDLTRYDIDNLGPRP